MDNLILAQKIMGKEKTTEQKSELTNPSSASIMYMIAVTASSGGQVVLRDEIEETAEWEEGDFIEIDDDGDFDDYDEDDSMEDVDDTVVDMTDGDGVDIEDTGAETVSFSVADYHETAVAAYAETEGEVEEEGLPDENAGISDDIDDGDAEELPDVGVADEDDLTDEETVDELSDDDYTLADDNSDDESDEPIAGAEVSDGYTVADCISSVKAGDRVMVMVQNGKPIVVGVVGSGDEQEALRKQAEAAAEDAVEAAADAQEKAVQVHELAQGAAQDASEAKQYAQNANYAATQAQNAANQAATEAQEAAQKARDAEAKADAVEENMQEVSNEVNNVKENAAQMRSELETQIKTVRTTAEKTFATKTETASIITTLRSEFAESIAGIQSTFSQDYAKKSELSDAIVDAKAALQTQITQNANQIYLTAKSVEDIQVDITSMDGNIATAIQTAEAAQGVANAAKTDAEEAQAAANKAKEDATAANTAANNAQTEANEAKSKADSAQSIADQAKQDLATAERKLAEVETNVAASAEDIAKAQQAVQDAQEAVDSAQEAADKAKQDAAAAQSTADQAKSDAANANTAAGNAQTKAEEAKTAADNAQKAADEAKEELEALKDRVVECETAIEQNSEAIKLRATKTELTAVADNLANNYYNKTDTIAQIETKAESILSTVSATYQTLDAMGDYSTTAQMNSAIEQKASSITSTVDSTYLSKTDANTTYATKTEVTQTASGLEVKITTAQTTADGVKTDLANNYTKKTLPDTRNDNQTPEWYMTNYPRQIISEFKYSSKIGLSGETYCTLETTVPWTDSSGGYPKQVAKIGGKEYWRIGTNATTWGAWNDSLGTAQNAAKTATNFLSYDSTNGLLVGNKTSGSWSGSRAQILPSAFNILDSSGNKLASYQASKIYLALNSKTSVIDMCNGLAQFSNYAADDWNRLLVQSENAIYLSTSGEIQQTAAYSPDYGVTEYLARITLATDTPWGSDIDSEYTLPIIDLTATKQVGNNSAASTSANIEIAHNCIELYTSNNTSVTNKVQILDYDDNGNDPRIKINTNNFEIWNLADNSYLFYVDTTVAGTHKDFSIGGKRYNDGAGGIYCDAEGFIQIQRNHSSYHPYISFYLNGNSTETADGMIRVNQSNGYMQFMQADRYTFDATVYTTASIGIGTDDTASNMSSRAITTPWKDGSFHYIVERNADGLTSAFGWAGSSSYATVTKIRGRTCQVQNASGTSALSDERLKKDFTELDAWDAFYDALQPCAFRLKTGNSGRFHMGFKAQQVEQALLDAGLTTNDFAGFIRMKHQNDIDDPEGNAIYSEAGINAGDDELGLIYSEFTALNTWKIQKMQKRIDELEKLVEQLLPI